MRKELTIDELEMQYVELLPTRETLSAGWGNAANVWASNSSMAFNAASFASYANSAAFQSVNVIQG